MEVARPVPNPPCPLCKPVKYKDYLESAVGPPLLPHRNSAGKHHAEKPWFHPSRLKAHFAPVRKVEPSQKSTSPASSEANSRRWSVTEVSTNSNKDTLSRFDDPLRQNAQQHPGDQVTAVRTLPLNFERFQRERPLCLKRMGLHTEIGRLLYAERTRNVVASDAPSTTCDAADGCLPPDIPLQVLSNVTQSSTSPDDAVLRCSIKGARVATQAKSESSYSLCHPHRRTEGRSDTASATDGLTAVDRRHEEARQSNNRKSSLLLGSVQHSPLTGLSDASLSPSGSYDEERRPSSKKPALFQHAFLHKAAAPAAAVSKPHVRADIQQLLAFRDRSVERKIRPPVAREVYGRIYAGDFYPRSCEQSAEKRPLPGIAEATTGGYVNRAHCVRTPPRTSAYSFGCQTNPVRPAKAEQFSASGDAFYVQHARRPLQAEPLVTGEGVYNDGVSRKQVRAYSKAEPGERRTTGSARSAYLQALKALARTARGSTFATCTPEGPSSGSAAVNQAHGIPLLRKNPLLLRTRSVGAPSARENLNASCPKRHAGEASMVESNYRDGESSATCARSPESEGSAPVQKHRQVARCFPVLNNNDIERRFFSRRMLFPTQVARLHISLLAWKRIATERSLRRNLYIAARRQTEGRLLRRCMLSFRQHKERRAQLHLKKDICGLQTLKHSASRHFTAWIRIFYAASARSAFLKSFSLRGFQRVKRHRQQQSASAAATHKRHLKLRALKSMQEYVNRRFDERAAFHQAVAHHEHFMLKKGLHAWCRWHAYMTACIKLLHVASHLERQQNQRILPVVFKVWNAEMKRSRAETGRTVARVAHFKVKLAFRAWWRRSAVTKLLSIRRKEYCLHVQENVFRHWRIAHSAQWKQREELERNVRHFTKRRGLIFLRVAFTAWRRYTRRRVELSRACKLVEKKRKLLVLQNCMTAAFLSMSSRRLLRSAAVRSASTALSIWKAYARQHKRERYISFFFRTQREKCVMTSTLMAWRHLQVTTNASKNYFREHALRKVWSAWRNLQKKRSSLRGAADTWERRVKTTCQARFFDLWSSRACNLRAMKTQVFSAWYWAVRRSKHRRMALEKLWQTRSRHLLSECWFTWRALLLKERRSQEFSKKTVARRTFRALVSYIQNRKAEHVKAARLKFRSEQLLCYRTFSKWLRKAQVRRRVRGAYETAVCVRNDHLLSSIFYSWLRAARLRHPSSSAIRRCADFFDPVPLKERYQQPVDKYKGQCNLQTSAVPTRRTECSGWRQECLLFEHVGGILERCAQNNAGTETSTRAGVKHTKCGRGLVSEATEETVNGVRRKDNVEFPRRERMPQLIREKSVDHSYRNAVSQLSHLSSEATTASGSSQRMGFSDVEVRLSRGRQQVYMDYFWDSKMLKILTAWRRIARLRWLYRSQRKTQRTSTKRYDRSPAGPCSVIDRSESRNAVDFLKRDDEVPADPNKPRFACDFEDDASYDYVKVPKQNSEVQRRPRRKLRQVIFFSRLRAKKLAFKNWLAFCHAKNDIVSRLEDEFRAVRCLRRWKLEFSRRRSLQALAHVHTHYLKDLDSTW